MADYSWMTNNTQPKTNAGDTPFTAVGSNASNTTQLPTYGQPGEKMQAWAGGTPSSAVTQETSWRQPQNASEQDSYNKTMAYQSALKTGVNSQTAYNLASSYQSPMTGSTASNSYQQPSYTPLPSYNYSAGFSSTQPKQQDMYSLMNQSSQPNPGNWSVPSTSTPSYGTGTQATTPNYGAGYDTSQYSSANFQDKNEPLSRYIENTLPLATFNQNAYQYGQDFNEAQRRWNAEFGATQTQNQYNMDLQTRQQQMAEWQAQQAASQWNDQFGWQQQTDTWNRDIAQQQLANTYQQGMDQNQASRDVAGTYANAQMYGSNAQLAGTQYSADQYSAAQRYQAQQAALANMYGSDQQLQGTLGSAGIYGNAQMYGSDQQLAGTQYGWNTQAAMNAAQMANNIQTANINAYGRSQAPRAQWASAWA